jgi:carboxymethylenebutenolidase
MIELIVALAVASQVASDNAAPAIPAPTQIAAAREVSPAGAERDPQGATPNAALDPAYLLDPSLPVTFLAPEAAKEEPRRPAGAVTLGRAIAGATGPESDEAFNKATMGDFRDEGRQAAPEWMAGPRASQNFGEGADLRTLQAVVKRSDTRYRAANRQVRLEIYRPEMDGPRPAVLLLHGASGMGDGSFYRGAAEMFASQGYVVYLPHYLGERNRNRPRGKALISEFEQQHDIVRAALDQMSRDRAIDAKRMGVFGFSLGGFQAMGLSSRDPRIAAVVNMGGGMPGNVTPHTTRLAPTLIVHGRQDRTVPVARAHMTREVLKRLSVPHEFALFQNQGHFFRGEASRESIARSVAFFDRYLRGTEAVATGDLLAGM